MNFGLWFSYDWKSVVRSSGEPYGLAFPVTYALPFSLTMFGKHIANGSWLVTEARPPMLASAGIVGLAVEPPDNKGKRLELRVIAARNAPP